MITVSVNTSFHEEEAYELKINNDVRVIDQFTRTATFSLPEDGWYRLHFEQKKDTSCLPESEYPLCFCFFRLEVFSIF